ncbi:MULTISPECIES: hypothetical protein [unclassified Lysinibacillus]|uniref:hypothetical protein n=1 Tax=unclassified Lysinibacillus TaxID=2636778 RepID=UPI0038057FBA
MMLLGACANEKKTSQSEFKKQYFEGKSDNWYVKMVSEMESNRRYIISYIGQENKPLNFKYEIYESSHNPTFGDGEFKNQEEFEIHVKCGGPCNALPNNVPILIQWEGEEEKVVIRNKK